MNRALYDTSIKSCILHIFVIQFISFALHITHMVSHICLLQFRLAICIVNSVNIVFIDKERKKRIIHAIEREREQERAKKRKRNEVNVAKHAMHTSQVP